MEVNELYEKLKEDLLRFAMSISRDPQEACDLVQEAWMKSLKEDWLLEAPEYKQRAWFFKVIKNKLVDTRRKESRLVEWKDDDEGTIQSLTFGESLEVFDLLNRLPKDWGDLIFKRYWVGLTSNEIGKQMDLPASTIRYKLHQAIKRLRKMIEEDNHVTTYRKYWST